MRIAIIGAGMIGSTTARLFIGAGHEVSISNSRAPESLQDLVKELGPNARAMRVDEAAAWAEVILLAVPWRKPEALPSPGLVAGKIVIDAMNPYREGGGTYDLGESTSSEETARRLPKARLVKAFNTIYFRHLADSGRADLPLEQRRAIFLAGDDAEAKKAIAELIEQIGFAPVDTGSLRDGGRLQQPESEIYNRPMSAADARQAVARLTR
jgi:predicted dinucleotide-binding enzyme